jgi:hypothetical protein
LVLGDSAAWISVLAPRHGSGEGRLCSYLDQGTSPYNPDDEQSIFASAEVSRPNGSPALMSAIAYPAPDTEATTKADAEYRQPARVISQMNVYSAEK